MEEDMENKPLGPKGPEPAKPIGRPSVTPSPSGSTIKSAPTGLAKPAAPIAKPTPPVAGKKALPDGKKKAKVTPAEVSKIKVALVEKLSRTPDGLRTVDLAKALNISTSKLTFVASDLLKSGEIRKIEVKDRVVYCSKDAKVATPTMERDKIFKDVRALLKDASKGMTIMDIASKTKHTRQKLAAALKPHIESGVIKKVNDVYLLTGKPAIEPAKKAATAAKPPLKRGPEMKEPPRAAIKPPVRPAYRPPEKVKTGKGIAWLAIILAIVSIILWLSVWGDNTATSDSLAALKQNFEQKTSAIDTSMSKMYNDMNAKIMTADMKVLNTFFNQQITSLEATLVNLDGLARMTDDEATHARVAKTKTAISALIHQLKAEYTRTIPQ
jgi:DNA-binding Lrp family transcriptional regulator